MLKSLFIENLALIDSLKLSFHSGLSVITGETGAGKSVVINALGLLLGERADRDAVRFGFDKGSVSGVFDISTLSTDYKKQYASYLDDTNLLKITREITRTGRAKITVNEVNTSVTELKVLTTPIAQMLGQHANQQLMNEDNHILFLDNFADLEIMKQDVAESYANWKEVSDKLDQIVAQKEQLQNEQELLLFQRNEIEKATITVGEEEQLLTDKKKLDSVRTLMASTQLFTDILESEQSSALPLLNQAQSELDKLSEIDDSLGTAQQELTDIIYRLGDLHKELEGYGNSLVDDPLRLEEINQRLDEIYNLKKKYGGSEAAILESLHTIKSKLSSQPSDIDSYIDRLEKEKSELFSRYSEHALALSDTRRKAATFLHKLVLKELSELAIDNAQFELEFLYEEVANGVILDNRGVKPSPNGLESGRFLFAANPGEPLKSLVKTASGGEISRILLAIKSAEKKNHKNLHPLMVFDEVDAGIGGKTALEVGKKLKRLASDRQLLVITHLHQIAREADHHYVVTKTNDGQKRVVIEVTQLDQNSRKSELQRMVALPD